MFEDLIVKALELKPRTTPELYSVAMEERPEDCTSKPCTHRKQISDMEWQHQLRREQQRLKRQGRIELEGDLWHLASPKSA